MGQRVLPGVPQIVKLFAHTFPSFMKGMRLAKPKSMILQKPAESMSRFSGCRAGCGGVKWVGGAVRDFGTARHSVPLSE